MRSLQAFEHPFFAAACRARLYAIRCASAQGVGSVNKDVSKTAAGASVNLEEIIGIIDQALVGSMIEGR